MANLLKFIALAFGILIFLWIAGFIAYVVAVAAIKPANITQKTDAIIVLTGGNYRIHTGLDLWSRKLAPELFITGVNEITNEKEILESWDGERDLPICCITLGFKAKTTRQNATETKEWIQNHYIGSARLVTSTYHMPRAYLEFKTAMPDLEIVVHPVEITDYEMNEKQFWVLALLEYNKMLARRLEIFSGHDWFNGWKK